MIAVSFLAVTLGAIFFASATGKIARPGAFVGAVADYQILPAPLVRAYGLLLPAVELLVGACLILGVVVRMSAIVGGLMLLSFCVAVGLNLWRGRDLDCHCFGNILKRRIGRALLAQDVILLGATCAVAVEGFWVGPQPWSLGSTLDAAFHLGVGGLLLAAASAVVLIHVAMTAYRTLRPRRKPVLPVRNPPAVGMSRRSLLKLMAAGIGALALGPIIMRSVAKASGCNGPYTGSTNWGTHLNTAALANKPPQDFYIFAAGSGTAPLNPAIINTTGANNAGYADTYFYWTIQGSHAVSGNYYQWGVQQANAALSWTASGTDYSDWTGAQTIFGAVEFDCTTKTTNNWISNANVCSNAQDTSTVLANNQQVLNGWLDTIQAANWANNGLYTHPGIWCQVFGTAFLPSQEFALWLSAGCWTCCPEPDSSRACKSFIGCAPCVANSDSGCVSVGGCYTGCQVTNLIPNVEKAACGGQQPALWHYWNEGWPCSGQDFDVAINDSYDYSIFIPVGAPAGLNWNGCGGLCDCCCGCQGYDTQYNQQHNILTGQCCELKANCTDCGGPC